MAPSSKKTLPGKVLQRLAGLGQHSKRRKRQKSALEERLIHPRRRTSPTLLRGLVKTNKRARRRARPMRLLRRRKTRSSQILLRASANTTHKPEIKRHRRPLSQRSDRRIVALRRATILRPPRHRHLHLDKPMAPRRPKSRPPKRMGSTLVNQGHNRNRSSLSHPRSLQRPTSSEVNCPRWGVHHRLCSAQNQSQMKHPQPAPASSIICLKRICPMVANRYSTRRIRRKFIDPKMTRTTKRTTQTLVAAATFLANQVRNLALALRSPLAIHLVSLVARTYFSRKPHRMTPA